MAAPGLTTWLSFSSLLSVLPLLQREEQEWFAAPAQSYVLRRQASATQKQWQSTHGTGQATLPFEVIRFSA